MFWWQETHIGVYFIFLEHLQPASADVLLKVQDCLHVMSAEGTFELSRSVKKHCFWKPTLYQDFSLWISTSLKLEVL